jgi:hypothetical protein
MRAAACIPQVLQEHTQPADSDALAHHLGTDRLAAALQRGLSLSDQPAAAWVTSLENTTANAYQALSIQPPAAPRARGGAAQAIVPAARSRAEVIAFNSQADHFSSPLVVFCNAEVLATRAARMAAKACAHTSLGSAGLYGDAEAELSTVSTAGRPFADISSDSYENGGESSQPRERYRPASVPAQFTTGETLRDQKTRWARLYSNGQMATEATPGSGTTMAQKHTSSNIKCLFCGPSTAAWKNPDADFSPLHFMQCVVCTNIVCGLGQHTRKQL